MRIIKAAVSFDLKKVNERTKEYIDLLKKEYAVAEKTASILENWVNKPKETVNKQKFNKKETALMIGVTEEVLQNWERNGLIEVPREGKNHTRFYRDVEVERLRIIYMLRQAKYSIAAIHQSLKAYDEGNRTGVLLALNHPVEDDFWVSVGDRWLSGLEEALLGAKEILKLTLLKI